MGADDELWDQDSAIAEAGRRNETLKRRKQAVREHGRDHLPTSVRVRPWPIFQPLRRNHHDCHHAGESRTETKLKLQEPNATNHTPSADGVSS